MTKEKVLEILKEGNFAPQKAKGQNFLIDDDVSRVIVELLTPHFDNVLEIGPGLGSLTSFLVRNTTKLNAVELDRGFVSYLQNTFPEATIIEKDFLKYSVPRETTSVISNIPYYITTKIIEKVLLDTPNLKVFVFMTQKDVKDRLFAQVNTKDYGPLSIILALLGKLEQKITVTADKFYPVPNVDSAVFRFTRNHVDFAIRDFYNFLKFIFLNRRKTMNKNLKTKYDKDVVDKVYLNLEIRNDIRSEALTPQQLLVLFQALTLEITQKGPN